MTAARRDGSIIAFAAIAVVVLAARRAARSSSWSLRKSGGPSAQMWIR
jgi:hypothetical protein